MADVTKEQVVDFLSKMSVMDMAALKTELEEKWGVKAAVAVAGGGAAADARGAGCARAIAGRGREVNNGFSALRTRQ